MENTLNVDQVVAEANKQLPGCDYVCDLFDLRFVWAGEKALEMTGYSAEDAKHMKNIEILDDSYTEESYRKDVVERVAATSGESDYLVKHKSGGKLKIHVQYQVFEFNQVWYIAGKVLNFKFLEEEAQQ